MKRKRSNVLPQQIKVEPAGGGAPSTAGPYAAFFPSGFRPTHELSCAWEVHSSRDTQLLVARTARTQKSSCTMPCLLTYQALLCDLVLLCTL